MNINISVLSAVVNVGVSPSVINIGVSPSVINVGVSPSVINVGVSASVINVRFPVSIPGSPGDVGAWMADLLPFESDEAAASAGATVYKASGWDYINGAHKSAYPGTIIVLS